MNLKAIVTLVMVLTLISHSSNDMTEVNFFTGEIEIPSQAELIAFVNNNYTEVLGGFEILSSYTADWQSGVNNLKALKSIQHIKGDLIIRGSLIRSLEGLNNITVIDGNFEIDGARELKNFNALEKLIRVGEEINIYRNKSLSYMEGLGGLTSFGSKFYSGFHEILTDFCALKL
jgi:hypothetical protein